MIKRILAIILAALMLGAAAMAEVTGPLFEAANLSDSSASDSGLFIYTEDWKDGLVNFDGTVQAVAQFGDLSYAAYGYFEATNERGFNTSALVDAAGAAVTPYEYSDFDVISPNWAVGVVLEGTNDKDGSDYSVIFGDYDYAVITRCDVFYLPEKKKVGTLERAQYGSAREAGINGWLLVADRNGAIAAYDPEFNAHETLLGDMYDAELVMKQESGLSAPALYSAVTGEKLAEGRNYTDYLYRIDDGYATFTDKNTYLQGILNPQGEEICPAQYSSISNNLYQGRYLKVSVKKDDANCEGLYDLEENRLVVPALYERIYTWGDKSPINDGYVCVEQDDKLGFIDLEGNVTCPVQYAKNSVQYYGCTLGAVDMTGAVTLIAADGTVTALDGVAEIGLKNGNTDSDGYFLTVKDADGNQGVVDWHGNQVVDFVMNYSAAIYRGDCLFTDTAIYRLAR